MRPLMTLTFALAGLIGCGGGASGAEPEAVVKDHLQSIIDGDLERAKGAWMTPELVAAHFDCPAEGAKLTGDLKHLDRELGRQIERRDKKRLEFVAVAARTPGELAEGAELNGCRTKSKTDTMTLEVTFKVVRDGKPGVNDTDPVRLAKLAGRWYLTSL